MLTKIQNAIVAHLATRSISDEREIQLYLISFVCTAFCIIVHLYLLVVNLVFGLRFFIWLNLFSMGVHCVMLLFRKKKRYRLIAMCISVEVSLYTTLVIVLTGISTHVVGYYLLVIILQTILPYESVRWRFRVGLAVGLGCLPAIVYSLFSPAIMPLSDGVLRFLTLSNIYILFIGTVVQLCMGSAVRRIIRRLDENRMETLSAMANTDPLTGLFNRRYAKTYFTDILSTHEGISYCVAI
jgi:hypothetical protein